MLGEKESELVELGKRLQTANGAAEESTRHNHELSRQIHSLATTFSSEPAGQLNSSPTPFADLDRILHHSTQLKSKLATDSSLLEAAHSFARSVLLHFPSEFKVHTQPDSTLLQDMHDIDERLVVLAERFVATGTELHQARLRFETQEALFDNITDACHVLEPFSDGSSVVTSRQDVSQFLLGVGAVCEGMELTKDQLEKEIGRLLEEKSELATVAS